jgi:death-on-curing protein
VSEPEWVLRDTVLRFHERLLTEFGGGSGIRDEALLDSALNRPKNLFLYGNPSLTELAGSYAFGLIRNHPFVDGNKRIGFAVSALFLLLNGKTLISDENDAFLQTLALAAGQITERDFAIWLQENVSDSA